MSETNPLEANRQKINTWLRYHTDHQVTINFYSIYGCLELKITRGDLLLHCSFGQTLEHRLDEAIAFLGIDKESAK